MLHNSLVQEGINLFLCGGCLTEVDYWGGLSETPTATAKRKVDNFFNILRKCSQLTEEEMFPILIKYQHQKHSHTNKTVEYAGVAQIN